MAIPAEFLEELKARVDLVSIVARRVALTRKGREHLGLCPFHQEKTPSFTVNEQKGFYHCFGCGAHGSAIDFVMQADRLEFRDAVASLAALAGLSVPDEDKVRRPEDDQRARLYAVNEAATQCFEAALRATDGRDALAYVRSRDLGRELIGRFRLGYAADGGGLRAALRRDGFSDEIMVAAGLLVRGDDSGRPPYPRFRNRVMFPIADAQGRILGFGGRSLGDAQPKYLNTAETEVFHKGRLLYGLALAGEAARRRRTIIVVEGYMDVIGLARTGIDHAVAPLGTALTEDQLRLLWRLVPEPILCFDPDRAGRRAAMRAAERALPLLRAGIGLRFAFLATDTGDDPDGVARRYPRQFLDRAFTEAVALSDVVLWMETGGVTTFSPEDRAAVEARLRRRLERVGDPDVRAHFLRDFRNRLWQRERRPVRQARGFSPPWRGRWEEPPPVASGGPRVRPPSALAVAERTLLACLLNNPPFYAQAEEALGSLTFSEAGSERLRQALVDVLASDADLSHTELAAALRSRGHGDQVTEVLADPLLAHHRALCREASSEDLEALWRENLAVLRAAAERGGDDDGAGAAAESDEAMRRRQLLKRAALEEGDDEA
ncbi:MAG: DNA primase [Rhodospirillales bacterium]|nr:DNA primase [Rhodospirillales bacterium]